MGTIPADENEFPKVLFVEGAAAATPAAGQVVQYAKADGLLYSKDDAGAETALGAAAHIADTSDAHDASAISIADAGTLYTATDVEGALAEVMAAVGAGGIPVTIIDAAGDLIVGTAADTAARLAIGATDGMALQRIGGALAWAFPPGYEYAHAQITSSASITATTEATANSIVAAGAVTFDGSTAVVISFFANDARPDAGAANRQLVFVLYDDTGGGAASVGQIGFTRTETAANSNSPIFLQRRLTPSNASHTYSIRAFVSAGTGSVSAGAGGSGNAAPAFIRITKV